MTVSNWIFDRYGPSSIGYSLVWTIYVMGDLAISQTRQAAGWLNIALIQQKKSLNPRCHPAEQKY